jgi:ribonuclease BN (tRNA processing enzyme)
VLFIKPANMTYEEAATLPVAGLDAANLLRKANIRPGEQILINGAGGNMGTYAVQIAKHSGAEVTGVDPEAALAGLLRRPYNPQDLKDLRHISVKPITDRTVVAGRTIRIRAQQHSDVSIAYRIEDDVVLATDTTPDPATADFAAGASLLLHEAWYSQKDFAPTTLPPGYASHSNVESVAALAKEAGVECLVLIHLNPLRDESYYSSLATIAQRTFSRSNVRRDGDTIDTDHLSHRT